MTLATTLLKTINFHLSFLCCAKYCLRVSMLSSVPPSLVPYLCLNQTQPSYFEKTNTQRHCYLLSVHIFWKYIFNSLQITFTPTNTLLAVLSSFSSLLQPGFFPWSLQHAHPHSLSSIRLITRFSPMLAALQSFPTFHCLVHSKSGLHLLVFHCNFPQMCFIYPFGQNDFPVCIFNLCSQTWILELHLLVMLSFQTQQTCLHPWWLLTWPPRPYPSVYLTLPLGCLVRISDISSR